MLERDYLASFVLCVTLVSVAALESPAYAQDNQSDAIDEIIVVAQKRARPISDIAANVTVLTQDEFAATLATSTGEMFRYTPGVDYEASGTRFGGESLNIRGIAGNRVAMMIDGIPVGDQFDVGRFSNATRDFVNAGLINRIEVLHGPASALYGSSAIGGVVAATTPEASDYLDHQSEFGGLARTTWKEANDSFASNALVAAGDDELNVLLGGSISNGHQFDPSAAPEALDTRNANLLALTAKLGFIDRFNNSWRAGIIYQDSEVESSLTSMLGTGRFRSTTALLGDDTSNLVLSHLDYRFEHATTLFDAGLIRAFYQSGEIRQQTYDERGNASRPVAIDRFFEFKQDSIGLTLNLEKDLATEWFDHQLAYGAEFNERDVQEYRDGLETGINDGMATNVLLGEVFPIRDFPISEIQEWGVFLEDVIVLGDWRIIAAIRADSYALNPQPDPLFDEDYPFATPVAIDESEWSPKFGLIRHIGDNAEVYVQYAHGFRAPPYEDANIGLEIPLFGYRAIPNPNLKSEQSDGIEFGFRWRSESSEFRLGAFGTEYQDFIESRVRLGVEPDSGLTLFQSQNISQTRIRGIEGGWNVQLPGRAAQWNFDGSFYYADGENDDTGEPLNSVGPAQLTASLTWSSLNEKRSLRLQGTFTEGWSHRDESNGELFKPPGYGLLDLYLAQSLGRQSTVRLGLLNLTDRTYWYWSDVRGLSPNDPVIPYLSRSGRSLSLSIDYLWQ